MTGRRRMLAVTLPLEGGFLQRQCPHCRALFAVDQDQVENRGLLNLRCSCCAAVAPHGAYTTNLQLSYRDAVAHHEVNKLAEEAIDDLSDKIGEMFERAFRGNPMMTVSRSHTEDAALPGPEIPNPNHKKAWVDHVCPECGFRWRDETAVGSFCPTCR